MCNRRKYPIVAAVFFAAVPAGLLGLVLAVVFDPWFGVILGGCFFGFSMDILLNSGDRRKHKRWDKT
jgi:hypothetical protein